MPETIRRHPNGMKKLVRDFPDDESTCHFQSFYDDGSKESEYQLRAGRVFGDVRVWHGNGQLKSQSQYREGKVDGLVVEWYANAQLAVLGEMQLGKRHGSYVKWYESGKLAVVGQFSDDKQHGIWLQLTEEGNVNIEHQWVAGEFVQSQISIDSRQHHGEIEEERSNLEVCFQRSGKTLAWNPKYRSILDLALANGVKISHVCWTGHDGVCLTRILSGEVDYPGGEPCYPCAADECLPCVAVPRGKVVLDA